MRGTCRLLESKKRFAQGILRNGLGVPGWAVHLSLQTRARMAGDRCALNPGGGEAANALSESIEGDEFPVASGESEDHWFRFASFGLPLRVGKGEVDGDLVNGGLLQRRQHAPSPRTELSRPSTLPH